MSISNLQVDKATGAEGSASSVKSQNRQKSRISLVMVSPSVLVLLVWMIVPLAMTIYFSLIRYNLLYPGDEPFVGLENYYYFLTDEGFAAGAFNTLYLVLSVLAISLN